MAADFRNSCCWSMKNFCSRAAGFSRRGLHADCVAGGQELNLEGSIDELLAASV